jgi:hypothetical protein
MTDKEFNKLDKHYNKLVKKGTIKTMNDACIYKLAIEKAIKVIRCCESDSELLKIPKTTKEQRAQLNEGYNKK